MNNNSRLSNSIKNVSFGVIAQVLQVVLGFVTRTIFINYLAVEYLGVNGLFTNILSLFSLAELGITNAILFALYKPLSENNEKAIAGLMNFYAKVYHRIAILVTLVGLALIPFLNNIVENPPEKIGKDLLVIHLLFLFNTVSNYFFYYKQSLLHANQRSYVVSKYNTIITVIQNFTQIVLLIMFKNFLLYLAMQSVFQLLGNGILSFYVGKYYPFLKQYKNEKLDEDVKKTIYSNVKSAGLVKVGGLLVNSTDNLILNYFSGLVLVGLLSNYNLLIGLASGLIVQVFSGLTGSIAHINVTESKEKQIATFNIVNFANFWIYGLAAVGIVFLMNDFVLLWIGSKFVLPLSVVIALSFNFYLYGMQSAVWTFKTTYGFFKQGQYLIILTAVINLVLSFVLGKSLGLLGILISTAIARLVTNAWYDPYIIYTLGLQQNPILYFKKYLKYLFILGFSLAILFACNIWLPKYNWILLVKLFLSLLVPHVMIYLFCKNTTEFKDLIMIIKSIICKVKSKFAL